MHARTNTLTRTFRHTHVKTRTHTLARSRTHTVAEIRKCRNNVLVGWLVGFLDVFGVYVCGSNLWSTPLCICLCVSARCALRAMSMYWCWGGERVCVRARLSYRGTHTSWNACVEMHTHTTKCICLRTHMGYVRESAKRCVCVHVCEPRVYFADVCVLNRSLHRCHVHMYYSKRGGVRVWNMFVRVRSMVGFWRRKQYE